MNGEAWKTWGTPPVGTSLRDWQNGRCASCGYEDRLVRDHCHQTGLIRGLLCHGCNNREGGDFVGSWTGWRQGDHPAAALRHVEVYVNIHGQTPFHPNSVLNYYSHAEQDAYWSLVEAHVKAGGEWPTSAPWIESAEARFAADQAQTVVAMERLSRLVSVVSSLLLTHATRTITTSDHRTGESRSCRCGLSWIGEGAIRSGHEHTIVALLGRSRRGDGGVVMVLDHGELNLPLHKRGRDSLDSQIDKALAAQRREARKAERQIAQDRKAARIAEAARPKLTAADLTDAIVVRDRFGWHRVVRVSEKSVTVATSYSWNDRLPLSQILEFR